MSNCIEKVLGGLLGLIIGDAFGVPFEFKAREEVKAVLARLGADEMPGYGSHGQPPGTWSDDSSLTLATVDVLLEGFSTRRLAKKFLDWYLAGKYTPHGKVFDVGGTTRRALKRIAAGVPPLKAGLSGEYDNGNGSLMRILPVAIYFSGSPMRELLRYVYMASRITHAHPRSLIACGIYSLTAANLIKGCGKLEAVRKAAAEASAYYGEKWRGELKHFQRIISGEIAEAGEQQIRSTGYVVDTLEASLWAFLTSRSYRETILKSSALGGDTDTIAAVAGGLAGIHYGYSSIPRSWLESLAKSSYVTSLCEEFARKTCARLKR